VQQALEDLDTPFRSVEEFMGEQMRLLLEKHEAWVRQRKDFEKEEK
jgi:hypothetical protein